MLQDIRDKLLGKFAIGLIGLIAVSFVFWGVSSPFIGAPYAAKVGGVEVSMTQLETEYRRQLSQYTEQFGELPELRGEVLPIGGLKEKLLAAHRGGISTVLIPHENENDLAEIPKNIKDKLNILPVKWIDQVLELALLQMPLPEPKSGAKKSKPGSSAKEQKSTDVVRPH